VYLPLYTLGTFTPHRKRKGVDLEALPCGAVSAERVLKARDCLDKITKLLSEKPHAPHDESKQKDLQDSKQGAGVICDAHVLEQELRIWKSKLSAKSIEY
jgi:hypothetical protein